MYTDMYTYMCMYMYTYMYTYMCMYMWRIIDDYQTLSLVEKQYHYQPRHLSEHYGSIAYVQRVSQQ